MKTVTVEFPNATKTIGNIHKVPKKQWDKWSLYARWTFNNMMRMLKDKNRLTHPAYDKCPEEYWQTIRWNTSWIAADLRDELSDK